MKNANENKNVITLKPAAVISDEHNVYLTTPSKVEKPIAPVVEATPVIEEAPVFEEETIKKQPVEPAYTPYVSKKKGLSLKGKKALSGWLFCLPFVLGIIGIYLPMVIKSIEVSFRGSFGSDDFLSFDAYKLVFIDDGRFTTTVMDAMGELVLQIPAIVIFSLFMAIILNQKMTGRTFFRAVFFLPVILSTGIIDAIDTRMNLGTMTESGGVDNNTGEEAGGFISALDVDMLLSNVKIKIGDFDLAEVVVSLINDIFKIVSRSGVQMLIFLSGLQSISPSIYESCQMEGATAWETFWKITLPMISPMILVNAIYTVVDLFTAADNLVMQGLAGYGGLFGSKNPGNFSAGIWVYILLVLVVIVIVALIMKTVVFYQRRD